MEMRADAVVTATYLVTLAAPLVAYASIRSARAGDHDRHRLVQAVQLTMSWIAVLALEVRIRLAGGSGALLALVPPDLSRAARVLLAVHITGAVVTYLVWTCLVVMSWRRYGARLPGSFSRLHKRVGLVVFGGLCFTAASATGMFLLAFVAQ
jgi:hypothetical protein